MVVYEGMPSLIAHIRIGKMQDFLEAKATVLPTVGNEADYEFSRSEGGSKLCEDRAQIRLVPCCTLRTYHSFCIA